VPDRKTIAAELRNAMNDSAIPEPNYIGVSEQASGKIEKTTEERKEFIVKQKELKEKFKKKNEEFIAAYTAHGLAQNTLPQGSGIVASLKAKYEAKAAERNAIKKQLDDLYKEFPEFAIRNTADTSKNSTSQTAGRPVTGR
jgi:seryl-tRNA synthetase